MTDAFFIPLRNNRFRICRFGTGPRLLIAFHGFKESGQSMAVLAEAAGREFTIYAPDLPFSGLTEWNSRYFTQADLETLIRLLAGHFGTDRFSLLGYSLGGRMALALVPGFARQMNGLVLLAPDGLKTNFWYAFVTRTRVGHALFRHVTYHPGLFRFMVESGFRLRLINESIYKFVKLHTLQEKDRISVYRVWTGMKDIRPDMAAVAGKIGERKLPTLLYFGRYDRIFPAVYGRAFRDIPSAETRIAESGHHMLDETLAAEIAAWLAPDHVTR